MEVDCAITAVLPQVTNTTSSNANTVPPSGTPGEGRQRENARPHTPGSGLYAHHGMWEAASSRASALTLMYVSTAMAAIQHQPARERPYSSTANQRKQATPPAKVQ